MGKYGCDLISYFLYLVRRRGCFWLGVLELFLENIGKIFEKLLSDHGPTSLASSAAKPVTGSGYLVHAGIAVGRGVDLPIMSPHTSISRLFSSSKKPILELT